MQNSRIMNQNQSRENKGLLWFINLVQNAAQQPPGTMTATVATPGILTEAVLEAMPIGVAVVDADRRMVLSNAGYCESLDLPPNSFQRGTSLADVLRVSAHRGIFGPGDPEAQVASFLESDRTRPGRLRRRSHHGRSFDVLQAPLPGGGYVVCTIETTALVAGRAQAETALVRVNTALATLRTGLAAFGPGGALLFANPRFGELFGAAPDQLAVGIPFSAMLDADGDGRRILGT